MEFDLKNNPFHLLKASYSSSASEIAELVEDAEFDGHHDVEQLQRAQQALVTPRNRLLAELSWLPELSTSQTTKALDLLDAGDDGSPLDSIDHFPELAKTNIAAHLLATGSKLKGRARFLSSVWNDVDVSTLTKFINEGRAAAGFPSVQIAQVRDALGEVRLNHAKAAAAAIWRSEFPGNLMNTIVEEELERNPSGSFLSLLVREYDARSERDLASIALAMDEQIEAATKADDRLGDHVKALCDLLESWDDVNQPVQLYEQYRGHEEGRSKQIYEKIRSLCLDLANDRGRYVEAKRLSEALLQTFPELESVADSLRKDVSDLRDLAEGEELQRQAAPLIEACEKAKENPLEIRRALGRNGFKARGTGLLSEIVRAFHDAKSSMADASGAYMIIRDLALVLNNERSDPETAFRFLDAFLRAARSGGPSSVLKQLDDERAVLHKNWKMRELEAHSGNLNAMSRIIDEMLKYATGSDKTELVQLKSEVDGKRNARNTKWGVFAAIAGGIGFFVIVDELDRQSSSPTLRPSTSTSSTTAATRSTPSNPYQEDRPAAGSERLLSTSEVRYCVFQGKRLDYMRPSTNSRYEIEQFNELVGDYNSRCSNFQYRPGVLEKVEAEAAKRASQLQGEAGTIVAGW